MNGRKNLDILVAVCVSLAVAAGQAAGATWYADANGSVVLQGPAATVRVAVILVAMALAVTPAKAAVVRSVVVTLVVPAPVVTPAKAAVVRSVVVTLVVSALAVIPAIPAATVPVVILRPKNAVMT